MTSTPQQHRYDTGNSHHSAREIETDIAETRRDMDDTLDKLGERLHPKHLLDHLLDYFRSNSASGAVHDAKSQLKTASRGVARQVKQHPIPYALMAAGAVWWMMEGSEEDEEQPSSGANRLRRHSGSYVDARTGQPYDDSYGAKAAAVAAWHPEFDWSTASHDHETWQEKAKEKLDSLKTTLQDASRSTTEKLKHSAASLLALSGRKRREIHSQWADLSEHSGSFVDARTGLPYDDAYGEQWQHLAACDYFADHDPEDEDAKGWSDKAGDVVEQIRSSLAAGGKNAKETLAEIASKIGAFGTSTGAVARTSGRKLGRGAGRVGSGIQHAGERAADGMHRLAGGAQHMAGAAQEQLRQGYRQSQRQVKQAVQDYPLAAGAAVVGMGLLAGFLLPRTRTEDRWMGETSDDLKERAQDTAEEAVERTKRVATATASAAMDEARKQGLDVENVSEQARRKVAKTAEKVEGQVHKATEQVSEKAGHIAQRAKETAKNETKRESGKSRS